MSGLDGVPIEGTVVASKKSTTTVGAAPLCTVVGLHKAIKPRLQAVADLFRMETKTPTVRRAPTVGNGWLPPKPNADADNYPFILVRPMEGTDTQQSGDEQSTAVLDLWVGTYSDDDDGYLDPLNIVDALRSDFLTTPRIAGTAFTHVGPLRWKLEAAARPQWIYIVNMVWQLPRPQRIAREA